MSENRAYDDKYDSYYDAETGEWLESGCDDADCNFCKNRPPKKMMNYCIGMYYDEQNPQAIGVYMLNNREIFYSDIQSAKNTLEHVKRQSPNDTWRIFEVSEYRE
jgi:hypothetical protein